MDAKDFDLQVNRAERLDAIFDTASERLERCPVHPEQPLYRDGCVACRVARDAQKQARRRPRLRPPTIFCACGRVRRHCAIHNPQLTAPAR